MDRRRTHPERRQGPRGRLVAFRPDWDQHRHVVMRAALTAKFAGPHLTNQLLATGDAVLIEGNHWHDQICARPVSDQAWLRSAE